MRIFGINEAAYYCSSFAPQTGLAEKSPREFLKNRLSGANRTLQEGSSIFKEYNACSLRDVERCLLLSASHYRRCLDLLTASAAPWAQVTAYYGSFYAAKALLGMFGVSIIKNKVVDVSQSKPGKQALRMRNIGSGPGRQSSTYTGTHRQFWDLFYTATPTLKTQVPTRLAFGLAPVSSNPIWQIEERNKINYQTDLAINLAIEFNKVFSVNSFPTSLPGSLVTQYRIMEALVEIAFIFSRKFSLKTDALNNLSTAADLRDKVRELIYHTYAPALVRKTKKTGIT
jgi:hypothetical protein